MGQRHVSRYTHPVWSHKIIDIYQSVIVSLNNFRSSIKVTAQEYRLVVVEVTAVEPFVQDVNLAPSSRIAQSNMDRCEHTVLGFQDRDTASLLILGSSLVSVGIPYRVRDGMARRIFIWKRNLAGGDFRMFS